MTREDVAVVCVLVLLLRLAPFPEPLFRISVWTLDAHVDGRCVDIRDKIQRLVVETTLQVERSCANWDLLSAARRARWGHLKKIIPRTLHNKSGHHSSSRLLQYVHAWT